MGLILVLQSFAVCIVFLVFLIYWKLVRNTKRIYQALRSQNVPSEPFIPIFGQLPALYRASKDNKLNEFLSNLITKHGKYFFVGFGPLPRLFLLEPAMIADVLSRSHAADYIKPADLVTVLKPIIGSNNLVLSEGNEHDRARKMINPAFYSNNLKMLTDIIVEQTSKTMTALLSSGNDEQTVDLQKEFSALTLSIITSSAFGRGLENIPNAKTIVCETLPKVLSAIEYRSLRMINQIPMLARLPFWQKHVVDHGSKQISLIVDQMIGDRREGRSESLSSNRDLLDLLLSSVDEQGNPFNDREIKDQSLTFVFAGHETTGNLMTWIAYVLMTRDDVLDACQEEVDRILPNNIDPNHEHLTQLTICEAVIQEALRLYPSAPFLVRECIQEHMIGKELGRQLTIPVGTTIVIDIYELHRLPEFWSRPLEFDYRRWLRDPITGLKPKLSHPYCYLPFSAGPRNCIGQHFAMLEAKIIMAFLIQRCHLQLEPGQDLSPNRMMNMRCRGGMTAKLRKRQLRATR